MGPSEVSFKMRIRQRPELLINIVPQLNQACMPMVWQNPKAIMPGLVYLTGAGANQLKQLAPAVAMPRDPDLLPLDHPKQQCFINDLEPGLHNLGQKLLQSPVYDPFLLITEAVPADYLVRKTLAAATDGVANRSGANADTGSFDGKQRHESRLTRPGDNRHGTCCSSYCKGLGGDRQRYCHNFYRN